MNNVLLIFINIIVTFSMVILIEKIFKKEGLYVWTAIALIMANILECQTVGLFNGFTSTCGNVLFASVFLATDIMSEKYLVKDSRKAILMAVFSQGVFILMMQLANLYTPSSVDLSSDVMKKLFSINLRVSISSICMFLISNMFDIYLFEKIKNKYPNKLWLRNNVATILSNSLENFFFLTFAFIGIYSFNTIIGIAITGSILETIIAICDTPFIYLSKKLK